MSYKIFKFLFLLLFIAFCIHLFSSEINAEEKFNFVVISHTYPQPEFFDEALLEIKELSPDFIVFAGDIIEGGGTLEEVEKEWAVFDEKAKNLDLPFYIVPGNHDVGNKKIREKMKIFAKKYGDTHKAITYKDNRFIFLNSVSYMGDFFTIEKNQLNFLGGELAGADYYDNVFIFVHHALWLSEELRSSARGYAKNSWNKNAHPLVNDSVKYVFAGDGTRFSHMQIDDVNYLLNGFPGKDMGHLKPSYLIVSVEKDDVGIELKFIGTERTDKIFYSLPPVDQQAAQSSFPSPLIPAIKENIKENLKISFIIASALFFILGCIITKKAQNK